MILTIDIGGGNKGMILGGRSEKRLGWAVCCATQVQLAELQENEAQLRFYGGLFIFCLNKR
jgi:hypothetical protein